MAGRTSTRLNQSAHRVREIVLPIALCAVVGWGCAPATAMYVRGRVTPELDVPAGGVLAEKEFLRVLYETNPIDRKSPPPALPGGWRAAVVPLERARGAVAIFPSLAAERSGRKLVLHFSGVVLCQAKGGNETPFAMAFVKARQREVNVVAKDVRYFETGILDEAHMSDVRARLRKGLEDRDARIRTFSALLLGCVSPDDVDELSKAHPSLAEELAEGKRNAKRPPEQYALSAAVRVHPVPVEPTPEPVSLVSE